MKLKTLQNLFFLLLCITALPAAAQKNKGSLQLNKGQKLQVDNTIKSVISMDLMGQSMEINSDAFMLHQAEVKDKKDTSYTIAATLTKMTTNGTMMGQSYSFDSDNKKDRDSSDLGKMMKDQLDVPKEMELNSKGQVINQKMVEVPAAADANPMMGMMKGMAGSGTDFALAEVFQVIPSGIKQGESWSDSVILDGVKTYRTYTLKEITNNIATIAVSGNQKTTKAMEQMGSEINLAMDSKISGECKVDTKTGIVQQKNLVIEGSGAADAMGQSIPLTMKVTSTLAVKNL
jgi:hypothetical protein